MFIDLSKAFDTLNHKILLEKLTRYGIRGNCLDWFTSYLENRQMRAKCTIDNQIVYSKYHNIEYGTPQGSCLGPLLFLVFINDLHTSITYSSSILFADDTTILHGHRNLRYLKWCVEEDMRGLLDWFRANQLTMNLEKTELILFSKDKSPRNIELELGNITLKSCTFVKFLGLWIDHTLSWKKHLSTLLIKLKQNTNLLKLGNKYLSKQTKRQIYFAHIYSHISYGLVIWGNMLNQTNLNKIQKCMDDCFKLITYKPETITNYQEEKLLRINQMIKLENAKLGYKLHNNLLPLKIQALLSSDSRMRKLTKTHKYSTRSRNLLKLPAVKSKVYHTSYLFQVLKEFSNTSSTIRDAKNIHKFVKEKKASLLQD